MKKFLLLAVATIFSTTSYCHLFTMSARVIYMCRMKITLL